MPRCAQPFRKRVRTVVVVIAVVAAAAATASAVVVAAVVIVINKNIKNKIYQEQHE